MNNNFSEVKVLIWDFDGTFYKPNPELFTEVRESEFRTIMEFTHWNHDKAVTEFEKYYKKVTPSATATVAKLCGITTAEAALTMEKYFDRRDYVTRDDKLISLFHSLAHFTHYILANGTKYRLEQTLTALGIPGSTFREILTSEHIGENKPSQKGFLYIMKKTGLPAANHMMIGDREPVDLVPAKNLSMHTCLVWSETKGSVAEITLPDVYAVKDLFV